MRLAYLRGAQRSGLWRRQSLSFIATRNCTVVQHPIREYGNQSDLRSLFLSLSLDHPRQGLLDHHHHHHCRRRRLECNTRLFGTDVDGNIGTRLQLIWKELRNHVDDNNAKANDIDFAAIDELLSILHQNGSSTDCIDAEKHADVYVKVSELQHEQTHTHIHAAFMLWIVSSTGVCPYRHGNPYIVNLIHAHQLFIFCRRC